MAVLVRVKRKRDELPSERLILAAPRAKRERSAREMLRSTFQGLGLTQPPPAPEQNLPVERRCFRRLDTLDAAAARDLEERTRGETAQRLLREALRLRRKRRPSPTNLEEASPTTTQSSPKRRQKPPSEAICVDLKDGALERSSPVSFEKSSSQKNGSRSLTDLTAFAGVERSPTNSSLDMLAPGGARETARDENSERRRLAAAVSTAMASDDAATLIELRAACGTPLSISLVCRDGATPLMAFARHGSVEDVARLVALGADSRRVDSRGRDAAMHAHARGHAAVRDRLLAATPPNPPRRVASEVHPKRSFLDGVSAYYEEEDVSHGDDAEMVGLPLDDFVYDVYAYDATADVEPRRVSTSRDHDGAHSLPDDLSRTVDCESLASRAMTPGGDTLSSSGESEDFDDGLSTRCVVSPRRRCRAAPLVVGIRHPLRDVLALPRTNEDDPAGTDGDDDVSSLGADDNDRNKSADDLSADGSLEDDDRSFRSHPMAAWDSAPPFFSVGGNGPPAAAFPSHSRDDASL